MRVLVVEDDATIAEFVGKGLREAGFAVDHAADGITALERATAEPYDASIVDVMLPRMDGLALIDALREYALRYESDGLPALERAVEVEQRTGRRERLFVRLLGRGADVLFVSMP